MRMRTRIPRIEANGANVLVLELLLFFFYKFISYNYMIVSVTFDFRFDLPFFPITC